MSLGTSVGRRIIRRQPEVEISESVCRITSVDLARVDLDHAVEDEPVAQGCQMVLTEVRTFRTLERSRRRKLVSFQAFDEMLRCQMTQQIVRKEVSGANRANLGRLRVVLLDVVRRRRGRWSRRRDLGLGLSLVLMMVLPGQETVLPVLEIDRLVVVIFDFRSVRRCQMNQKC